MRIATSGSVTRAGSTWWLHPVFGPGEDRNFPAGAGTGRIAQLHPVFGPGEDRNSGGLRTAMGR